MAEPFSIRESLIFGWHKTRAHSGLLFQVLLTLFALQVVQSIVQEVLKDTLIGVLASLALGVVGIVLGVGFMRIGLAIARGHEATYSDLVPPGRLVWHVFLASLLSGLIVVGGLILLIIPGVYFILRYLFVRLLVLDGAKVTESLGKSAKMTEDIKWQLLGFVVVLILLNLVGALAFLVGLLVTIPVSLIAYVHVYEKLKHRHHHA